jgi:hypothetical protein
MSSNNKNNTEMFYKDIINKLCDRVKEEFLNEGVAEDVLSELKRVKFYFLKIKIRYGLKN